MKIQTKNRSYFIRTLLLISSFIFLSLIVGQTIKIYLQYLPEELQISDKQAQNYALSEYHASDTYSSLEIVDENSNCSDGYSPAVELDNVDESTYCQCGDKLYFNSCNDQTLLQNKGCFNTSSTSFSSDFLLYLNSLEDSNFDGQKRVKLCGKKIDSSKFTWMGNTEQYSTSQTFSTFCYFNDTQKMGVVRKGFQCPMSSTDLVCIQEQFLYEHICETSFFISCIETDVECPHIQCKTDEIGCISKFSSFCIKNTEQCPLSNVQLIKADSTIPTGYEELEIKVESKYKLVGRRNSIEEDYISRISINPSEDYHEGEALKGFNQMNLSKFIEANHIQFRALQPKDGQNKLRFHRKEQQENEKTWNLYCSFLDFEGYNLKVLSNYIFMLSSRILCILLFSMNLLFNLKLLVKGYRNSFQEGEEGLKEQLDQPIDFSIYIGEIVLLPFILSYFNEEMLHSENDLQLITCLQQMKIYQAWEDAEQLLLVREDSYVILFQIALFSLLKLMALLSMICEVFVSNKKRPSPKKIISELTLLPKKESLGDSSIFLEYNPQNERAFN